MQIYVVEPLDTVDSIANKFGTPVEEIIFAFCVHLNHVKSQSHVCG